MSKHWTILHGQTWNIYDVEKVFKHNTQNYWWAGWPKFDNYWEAYAVCLKLRGKSHTEGIKFLNNWQKYVNS